MRFATFNLMHGRSLTDGLVNPDRLAAAVRALDADVIGLQEVDRGQPRSSGLDIAALAASAAAATAHRFTAAVVGTPGERWRAAVPADAHDGAVAGDPEYGVALLSRWPVRSWHVIRLAAAPVRSPVYVPGPGNGLLLIEDEPRVLLAAVVTAPTGAMTVATTHLSFVPGWNVRQLRQAVRALRELPAPRVLLGDLNLPGRIVSLTSGWRVLGRMPTYPAPRPRVQLDHIVADPQGDAALPPVTSVRTPESPVSDHRPLVVDLG